MKAYPLKSVEYESRRFSDCSLVVDEATRRAELLRPTGRFRSSQIPLMSLPIGPGTQVEVQGATVKLGPVTMVAADTNAAQEISKELLSAAAKTQSAERFTALRDSVFGFLRTRQEGIEFLLKLKADPRQAMVEKEAAYKGNHEDPAQEYLEQLSSRLSEAYSKVEGDSGAPQGEEVSSVMDRVYALMDAVGVYQDCLVSGRTDASGVLAFLDELGVDMRAETARGVKIDTEAILKRAEGLFGSGTD